MQKVKITMECDSDLVGEILASVTTVAKRRNKDVVVTSVEDSRQAKAGA